MSQIRDKKELELTFSNLWENKDYVIKHIGYKLLGAGFEDKFMKLKEAQSEEEFMAVIYSSYHIINKLDSINFKPKFDKVGTLFSKNGLCWVSKDNKYGFIDKKGNLVIDLKYDKASTFDSEGFAVVELNGEKYKITYNK